MQEFLLFTHSHFCDRYSRPSRYDVGNIFGIYLLLNERLIALHVAQLLLNGGIFIGFILYTRISDFCHLGIIAFTFGALGFKLQRFDVGLVLLNAVDKLLFRFPLGADFAFLVAEFGYLLLKHLHFLAVALALYCFALYLELRYSTSDFVERLRHRVHLKTQFRCRFIYQVDSLIGQESVGNISLRELYGSYYSFVENSHLVVILVAFLQTSKYGNSAFFVRLVHHNYLKTAFKGFILFEIFLIFVEGGSTYASQFATSKGGLQDIGCIHSTFALTGTYQCMNFIDKQDYVAIRLCNLIHYGLKSLLKFTFILGACHQCTHIE